MTDNKGGRTMTKTRGDTEHQPAVKNIRRYDTREEQAASDRQWDALTLAEQSLLYVIAEHFVHNPGVGCGLEHDEGERHLRITCIHCGGYIVGELCGVPYARLIALGRIWITPNVTGTELTS